MGIFSLYLCMEFVSIETREIGKERVRPPLLYAPAEVSDTVCGDASCTRNSKALKKIFSTPSAQKVKNFLRASREKEISFLEGGDLSKLCYSEFVES